MRVDLGPPAAAPPAGHRVRLRTAAAACVAVAALSLLLQRTPDFDPTAWLIWGRQLAEGTLSTVGGPSWKPLPALFTTPFVLTGDASAPALWLLVARTGGLLALVLAFRVAARLAGRTAGLLAAAGLALATDFLWNAARGDAEGLLVALALAAVGLHLDGRRSVAFLAGVGAALIRPEVWPLLAVYGSRLVAADRRWRTLALVGAAGLAVLALWFVPERIGSGDWFRAATRAQHPVDGSPGQSAFPFLMTFVNSSIALSLPVYAGAVHAVAAAWRARPRTVADRTVLTIAAASTVLMAEVALLAERGFSGNLRYVTLPAGLLCVLGGVGLSALVAEARRGRHRLVVRAAVAAGLLSVAFSAGLLVRNVRQLAEEGRVYGRELPRLIALAGGERAIRACGPIGASHFERQAVAWHLHLRQRDVVTGIRPVARTVFGRDGTGAALEGRAPVRRRFGSWVLRSDCPLVR